MKAPRSRRPAPARAPAKVKVLDGPRGNGFDGFFFRTIETPDGGLQVQAWDPKKKEWYNGGTLMDLLDVPFAMRRDLDKAGIPHGPEDLPETFPTEEEDAARAKNNDAMMAWFRSLPPRNRNKN